MADRDELGDPRAARCVPVDPDAPSRDALGRRSPSELAAVAAGGMLGTIARYAVDRAMPASTGGFPVATFLINTSGAFLLGLLLTVLLARGGRVRHLQAFACVGVLGAWTTMSALAIETDLLVRGGHVATAIAYVASSLIAGIAAAYAGSWTGRRAEATS